MTTIYVRDPNGAEHRLPASDGLSLMQIIRGNGIEGLPALCGGCCCCGTCHIYVDPAFTHRLPEMSADEDEVLRGSSHRTAHSRLSCQISCTSELEGLRLQIAPQD